MHAAAAGVVGILMGGEIQYVRIGVKAVLGPIPMVQIPVHNHYSLISEDLSSIVCAQSNIIE